MLRIEKHIWSTAECQGLAGFSTGMQGEVTACPATLGESSFNFERGEVKDEMLRKAFACSYICGMGSHKQHF